jgi:putative tricarboxylic transport membrane protein
MRRLPVVALVGAVLGVALLAVAPRDDLSGLRIMVPNAPGSGYDVTARTVAKALEDTGLVRGVQVFNLPGAGGAVGVQRLVYERGSGVVGDAHGSGRRRQRVRPCGRRAAPDHADRPAAAGTEHGRGHRDSPYRTLADLVTAWRFSPSAVAVGGGSLPGGPDHLAPMLLARAVGVSPSAVRYVRYDGGGELLAAILGKEIAFGVAGVGEYADQVRSGQLRVLAVTGPTRAAGPAAPTLREAGVDLEFTNWRGIVAPPGLSSREATALRRVVGTLVRSPAWRSALARNGWTDAYLDGPGFDRFLAGETARLDSVMADLGLAPA